MYIELYTVIGLSEVLSIRISKELKKAMRNIKLNWRKEIEEFIKHRIRIYLKEYYIQEAKKYRKKMPTVATSQARWIREDRNGR